MIVRLILTLLEKDPDAKFLVCGDSNQSVNNICIKFIEALEELKMVDKVRFTRFLSVHAFIKNLEIEHLKVMSNHTSFFLNEGMGDALNQKRVEYNNNIKRKLDKCQIIFCTLSKAASLDPLFASQVSTDDKQVVIQDKFKYAIVDEAS
jgi:hypothetical protein